MIFRFIGTEVNIGSTKLTKFGEPIEMTPEVGAAAIAGDVPIIPDAEFKACKFTPEELEEYAYPGPRTEPSAEFAVKWKGARIALHNIREKLKAGGTLKAEEKETK